MPLMTPGHIEYTPAKPEMGDYRDQNARYAARDGENNETASPTHERKVNNSASKDKRQFTGRRTPKAASRGNER